jgi:hypothetical protein
MPTKLWLQIWLVGYYANTVQVRLARREHHREFLYCPPELPSLQGATSPFYLPESYANIAERLHAPPLSLLPV